MNKEVKEIVSIGKDSIVQLALELIDEKIDPQNFSRIKVMANHTKVYVSFMNPIKYLPIKTAFYFDISVDIIAKTSAYGPTYNGVSQKKDITFYKPTTEAKRNIQFVIEAINKNKEIGNIDIKQFEDSMIISEFKNYYNISIVSEFQESSYKIKKISGKIYDSEHAHLEPPPFITEDKLKEIN